MTKKTKYLLFLVMCLFILVPSKSFAEQSESDKGIIYVNPNISSEDSKKLRETIEKDSAKIADSQQKSTIYSYKKVNNINEAVVYLRKEVNKRNKDIKIAYKFDYEPKDFFDKLLEKSYDHTGVATEGDYIQFSVAGYNLICAYNGGYKLFDIKFYYYDSYSQEQSVAKEISNIMNKLNISNLNTYDKVYTIYNYICQNIAYDYKHEEDDYYLLKYSPYAAIVKKEAVCQGYSLLLYRMLLQCGIDNRMIPSIPKECHIWNIIKVGKYYYNADATWDAGYDTYNWFLRCDKNFAFPKNNIHTRDKDYNSWEFRKEYPMSEVTLKNTTTGIKISWNKAENATEYILYVKNGNSYTKLDKIKDLSYTYSSVKAGNTYTFAVKALNDEVSEIFEGVSIKYLTSPEVKLTNSSTGIKISWNKVTGADSYKVYVKSGSSWKLLTTTKNLSHIYNSVKSGSTYTFTVKAISGSSSGTYKETSLKYIGVPSAKLKNTTTGIKISWSKVTGADRYKVYVKSGSLWKELSTCKGTTYTYNKVAAGSTYTFKVIAINKDIKSSYKSSSIKYLSCPKVKVSKTRKSIDLTWNKVKGASEYKVYILNRSKYKLLATTKKQYYKYTSVKSGKKYTFVVKAVNGSNSSAYIPVVINKF